MRTSTAEKYDYRCPECGDELSQDLARKGFVRHKSNPKCQFENRMRDDNVQSPKSAPEPPSADPDK